jgi:hypothetical protein
MIETKPLSRIAQSAFSLAQQAANQLMQKLADEAMADAGMLVSDGWRIMQQPDGQFRFERTVPETEAKPA